MRLAAVVPPGGERYLPETSASFCYANIAAKDPLYASFYASRKGVILDWPIYEDTPIDITPEQLFAVSTLVHPEFLIVPDVRHNAAETLVMADAFASAFPGWERMTGVLQGKTFAEYAKCAEGFVMMNFKRLAIPKDFTKNTERMRSELLSFLLDEGIVPPEVKWHLLGGDWPYASEHVVISQSFPQVISMDTAEPWNAAYHGDELWSHCPPPRSTKFNQNTEMSRGMIHLFHSNIRWLQEHIRDDGH